MFNSHDLLIAIKKAATEAVEAGKPCDYCFGEVVSVTPLKISVEQKMTLGVAQLVLTRNVTDYTITIGEGEETKQIKIRNGLKIGEKVVLFKQKGGQKYLVSDRAVNIS